MRLVTLLNATLPGITDTCQTMPHRTLNAPPYDQNQQQNYFARNHRPGGLPSPHELVHRIEEAKASAKLLLQVVQSTPPGEMLGNDLIKEFAERCQSASRSIQGYIHSDNPAPDDDTMLTLIETNDELSQAMSKHQRALLQARRLTGAVSVSPSAPVGPPHGQPSENGVLPYAAQQGPYTSPPSEPAPPRNEPRYGQLSGQYPAPPETYTALPGPPSRKEVPQYGEEPRNPFDDHHAANRQSQVLQAPFDAHAFGAAAPPGPPPSLPEEESQSSQTNSYHPEYQPTQSYMYRQESGANNYTMHGASMSDEQISPVETKEPVQYRF